MKSNILSLLVFTAIFTYTTTTQAQVGIGTASPNASAQLEVNSSSKGFLPPRMTSTQRAAITTPASGLMVYQTDGTVGLYYYNGSAWIYIINATSSTLPVANGGTGATTAADARANLGLTIGTNVLAPNGSAASLTSFPTLNQNTTGTAGNVTGVVAVGNGGTGVTTSTGSAGSVVLSTAPTLSTNGSGISLFLTGNSNNESTINLNANNGSTRYGFVYGHSSGFQVGSDNNLPLRFMVGAGSGNTPDEYMRLTSNGRLGIGTANPEVPLHVFSSVNQTYANYRNYNRFGTIDGSSAGDYSIYASNLIRATGFNAISDARIKRDVVKQNTANQLLILNNLSVVNYTYIDKLTHGSKTKTGFIAQQVEAVNSEFVNQSADFVPSVFAVAEAATIENGLLAVTTEKPHGFEKGDEVKLFAEGKKETIVTVADVNGPNTFAVKDWTAPTKDLFVYGKKVYDFRAIDFDQINALSVAAIQELSKQVDALKVENEALKKSRVQNTDFDQLKAEVELLKMALLKAENK